MRAAVATGHDALEVRDVPVPAARAGEVVVAVEAAGVGYVDVMALAGAYPYFPGPGSAPGLEVVGRVLSVGEGVTSLRPGERVLALPAFGGFAEAVAVAATRTFPVPDDPDDPAAAQLLALGLNAIVAAAATRRAGVREGDRVLVRGAGGGIGLLLVQFARRQGAEVTAVTSSASRRAALSELGAARTLDRPTALAECGPLDVVLDTAAGDQVAGFVGRLDVGGRYVLCGGAAGPPGPDVLDAFMDAFHRSPTLSALSLNSVTDAEVGALWRDVLTAYTAGEVRPVLGATYALDAAAEALAAVADRPPFGKVVLEVG